MRLRHLLPLIVLTLSVIITMACGPEQAGKFARGANGAAAGIDAGIDTVRAFREAGEITPERSLELAHAALDVNTVLGEAVDFTLSQPAIDEEGRQKLHDQFSDISERARRLVNDGTLHIKNGKVKLLFTLGTVAGQAALDVAVDDLAAKLPDGFTITVDAETKKTLEAAREKIKRNDTRLREAIENLDQLMRGISTTTGTVTIGTFTDPAMNVGVISVPAVGVVTLKQVRQSAPQQSSPHVRNAVNNQ